MSVLTKKALLKSVNDGKATFINEEYICKDCWEQEYLYKGVAFYVNVYSANRWLEEDSELLTIEVEKLNE